MEYVAVPSYVAATQRQAAMKAAIQNLGK